jgi:Rrf2 family transcriptional regulator, cysteine metabolism repressor
MIKVSTKGRYGLRSMIELACHYEEGPVLRETVAKNQEISKKYIHNLFTVLKHGGLIRSVRGKKGGYALSRHPSEILISEIIETLEGPIMLVDCVGNRKICRRSPNCLTIKLWEELGTLIKISFLQ